MTEFKIIEHMSYDWMIAAYFFLGGLSVGSYLFSIAANYWKTEFKPLAKTAAILAPIALGLGMLFLIIDLGQPLRAWRLFTHFNLRSAISWGTWFLNIFFALSAAYAFCLIKGKEKEAKKIAYAGIPFALLVATYTAVILAQAPGRELWRHIVAIIPWLFLIGGIVSGIALVILASAGRKNDALLAKLGKFLACLVLLEVCIVFTDIVILLNGGVKAVESAKSFLIGNFSILFWIVEIFIGALMPVYILLKPKVSAKALAVASMAILIGMYTMRYIIVVGAQVPTF